MLTHLQHTHPEGPSPTVVADIACIERIEALNGPPISSVLSAVSSSTIIDVFPPGNCSSDRQILLPSLRVTDISSADLLPDDEVQRAGSDKSIGPRTGNNEHRTRIWCCRNFCDACPDVLKFLLHVTLLVALLVGSQIGALWARQSLSVSETNAVALYGILPTIVLFALRCCGVLAVPQVVFSVLGHTCFNSFRERPQLRIDMDDAPRIIFRVVTRGNYPELVHHNVERNLRTIHAAGVRDYFIEVVTDKPVNLRPHRRVLETVVPTTYHPSSGAMFKARALQYCLEPATCWAEDSDWLVHLDEETILTQYSINGILNFTTENDHDFGQGVITYAQEHVVNWIFTLADSFRVADDMGKLQFQLRVLKRPVFGWKGSFVVSRAGAERQVTFNHGPDGSVAEDTFFAFMAFQQGYRFGFIEGQMLEKSPFGIKDFLQQRKRWIQGLLLVAHSGKIAVHYKLLFFCSLYAWLLIPFATINLLVSAVWPIPTPWWLDCLNAFLLVQSLYMYVFGAFKTCSLKRATFFHTLAFVTGALLTLPINVAVENVAAIWGVLGHKHRFYIVDKNYLTRTGVAAGYSTESLTASGADEKTGLKSSSPGHAVRVERAGSGAQNSDAESLRHAECNNTTNVNEGSSGGRIVLGRRGSLISNGKIKNDADDSTLEPLIPPAVDVNDVNCSDANGIPRAFSRANEQMARNNSSNGSHNSSSSNSERTKKFHGS